jgi:hypothetical protein
MAIPKSKPRQTGPKSDTGKKKSSFNALQHGASANLNLSQTTYALARAYEAELLEHYSPENPLVKLQIQRIAMTRAKLMQLYELEQAKMSMVYKEFDENPEPVMQSIKDADELVKNITLDYLKEGVYLLPFELQPVQIKQVAKEASSLRFPVLTHEDIDKQLPNLFRLLTSLKPGWLIGIEQGSDALDLLKLVGDNFRLMFKNKRPSTNELRALLDRHLDQFKVKEESRQMMVKEPGEFTNPPKLDTPLEKTITSDEIKAALKYFIDLDEVLDQVVKLVECFKVQSELMRSTLTLSTEDSDRLSRYQTNLERRLSTQIGELRVMLGK